MSQHNYERKQKTDDDDDEVDPVEEMVKKTGECGSDRGQFQASNATLWYKWHNAMGLPCVIDFKTNDDQKEDSSCVDESLLPTSVI